MNTIDEFRLQEYQDLGLLCEDKTFRLKRNKYSGVICLEKRIPMEKAPIYQFLQKEKISGIPEIFACIEDGQELIVIEKYIEGKTLESIIHEGQLEEDEIIDITLSLCDTLYALHHGERTIICRDLKAENIMIDRDAKVWIVDFDIARVFQEGKNRDTELLGTAEYAAPEQFGFFQTDQRTDIYALGVLMNYMFTGHFPVEHMVSGRFEKVVETCTYLDPEKRYQDVASLKKDLLILSHRETEGEKTETMSWAPPGFRKRNPLHMLTAIAGYAGITRFAFTMQTSSENMLLTGPQLRIEQLIFWIAALVYIFILCDYRKIRRKIPLLNHGYRLIRWIVFFVTGGVLFFGAVFLCALIETFIF